MELLQWLLQKLGISFLRFDDSDIKFAMNNVLMSIEGWIMDFEDNKRTHP